MLRLPNETLVYILQDLYHVSDNFQRHGNKGDLLSIRTVCKRLADVGAHLAFRHITLKHQTQSYQKILAFSESAHKGKVRYITYSFEDFEDECIPREEFSDYITQHAPLSEGHFSVAELDQLQRDYCCRQSDMCYLESTGLDTACLTVILPRLISLRSICISQCFDNLSWLKYEEAVHDSYMPFLELSSGLRVFDNVIVALSTTHTSLTGLSVRSHQDNIDELPLTGIIQSLNIGRSVLYKSAFNQLKSFSISIPQFTEQGSLNYDGLLLLLDSMPSLETLKVSSISRQNAELSSKFLQLLTIPNLHTVEIYNGYFPCPSDLNTFFSRHSHTLKRVQLRNITLFEGSWETVISFMRESLLLGSTNMAGDFSINGNWVDVEIYPEMQKHGRRVLPFEAMESFIERRSNVNPFELLRANHKTYPPHTSSSDKQLCEAGVCPFYFALREAEKLLTNNIRDAVTRNAASDPVVNGKMRLLAMILDRQDRLDERINLGIWARVFRN